MNTIAVPMPRAALLRCYALESRNEFLRLLRAPSFALPTLLFPPLFYTLFALLLGHRGSSAHAPIYLLATYGVFGVMAPGLFGFGVTLALDRERGLLTLKRAQPMPPGAYLAAKLVMAMLFATLIFTILALLATGFGGVRLPAGAWLRLLLVDALGVLPFCAIGLYLGSLVGGQGAPALINLVYLPMAFLSGLWMPLTELPGFIAQIAPVWPAWHLGRLALGVVGEAPLEPVLSHVLVLAVYTLVFLALARRRLARA